MKKSINNLRKHLKIHKKDKHSKMGLLKKINRLKKINKYKSRCGEKENTLL
ncbi:30S ribosomal protein S15 [Candidatus Vidania fulgoroideorum]